MILTRKSWVVYIFLNRRLRYQNHLHFVSLRALISSPEGTQAK